MEICYLCTQKNITQRLKRHLGEKHRLVSFEKSISDYSVFDVVLIVEPLRIKGQYLSVYETWKLFLERHYPDTKLLIAGFGTQQHPNFIHLLDLNDSYSLEEIWSNAALCSDKWEGTELGNGYDQVSRRLKLFFKGHNYNSIIDAVSKVRQMLNNAELSLYGSPTLNREKESFRNIWEKLLWPKRKFLRHFYSRWYNYKEYFEWMPFFPQLEAVNANTFINNLQQFFTGHDVLA